MAESSAPDPTETRLVIAETVGSVCWLAMDAAWMLSEIWALPALMVTAKVLCGTATGLLLLAFSQSRWRPEARMRLFAGFRRLRVAFQPRPKV